MSNRILVWDLPTRVFHWALALSFAGAFLTAESERWRDIHEGLGYTMLGLLAFRLVWGGIGTRYARFRQFVRGPAQGWAYVRTLASGRPRHSVGHNPLGAIAIVLLIGLGFATGVSGWLMEAATAGEIFEEVHEACANAMLGLVILHILGVAFGSLIHRDNLVRAMITGRKRGAPGEAITDARPLVALLLVAGLAGFWTWSLTAGRTDQAQALAKTTLDTTEHDAVDDD
jgi:cytochrome b